MIEEQQQGNIAKGQDVESEENKCGCEKTLEANDICILETRGKKKLAVGTCVRKSTKEQSLNQGVNQELNPTKLGEMINNSTKEAIQIIAKHYSMDKNRSTFPRSKEPAEKSRACRSRIEEEEEKKRWKNLSNVHDNRTRCLSRNSSLSYGDPYPHVETHECTIPLSIRSKNKKHWNPASNVNTDNRRTTGNINIYICSQANDNGQAKGKQKLESQACIDASSDASTELRSDSRCVSGSSRSAPLRKLINGIREERRKVQSSDSIQAKREKNNGSTIRDTETWRRIRTTETSDSNEDGCHIDVKLSDQEDCKYTISSARDVCSRSDNTRPSSRANLGRDSSNSVMLSCDNFQTLSSWIAIYPSGARYRFDSDDTDLFLSSMINVPNERKDHRKNDHICGTMDSEYTVCDIIDGSGFADDSKYRDTKFRDSILNRRNIWEKRMGCEVPRQSVVECGQGQQRAARQWSMCSCIAEEEEDYRTNVEKELPENLRPMRIICSELARDATVRMTSLSNTRDCFEKVPICKTISRVSKRPTAIITCKATLENSQESLKITRVSRKLPAEELPRDVTVCETTFAEPKGPRTEEETVCETADLRDKSDSKTPNEAPEETICKVLDSNFADRDGVEKVSANDAKDKLAKEKANSTHLNNRNVVSAKRVTVRSNDRRPYDNVISNLHFDGLQPATDRRENISYKRFNNSHVSIGTIRDLEPLSKSQDFRKFSHAVEFHGRSNYSTISNAEGTLRNLVDREKSASVQLSPLLRPVGSRFRSAPKDSVERGFTSTESKQSKEKIAEKSKEEDDKKGSPDKIGLLERNPKDMLLYRSLKKLLDVIRRHKAVRRIKDEKETDETRNDSMKRTKRDEEDDTEPNISERVVEINDYEKDERWDIGEEVHRPTRPPLANKHETAGNTVFGERQKSTAFATTLVTTISKGDEKADISSTNQTAPLKSKLLRIIAAKRLHLRPQIEADLTDSKPRELGTKVVSDEIPISERVDRDEIPSEPISAKITGDTIAVESMVRDVSAALVQDASKDVADIPKDTAVDENRVSEGVADETTDVRCPRKKVEEESRKSIPCECGIHSEPNSGLLLATERTECNDPLEDCFRKRKELQAKEEECILCAPPAQYPKSRSKIDKLIFRSVMPLSENPRVCTNCRGTRKQCKYKQRRAVTRFHCSRYDEECGCATCECGCSLDGCNKTPMSRVANCCRRRDKCYRGIEEDRNRKKPMICLYCDNSRDECTCRAPIGKCPRCGLPSDVCDCQNGQGHDRARARERVVGCTNKGGSMRITSWKPKREIRRYFARNDLGPDATKDCRCYEKPKRQRPEELPYQRLNVFSDVMNELQKKMSESICCTRCRRNLCCCCCGGGGGSQVNIDEEKEGRRVEDYMRYAVTAREQRFPRR